MSHQANVGKLVTSLAPKRTPSNLFLNHDEQILQVLSCDAANPIVHMTPLVICKIVWDLIRTCCCWLLCWKMGSEVVKNVLVLTNQRLIKFKEGSGSEDGNYPRRCAHALPLISPECDFFCFYLELAVSITARLARCPPSPHPFQTDTACNRCTSPPFSTPKPPTSSRCPVAARAFSPCSAVSP